MYKVDLNSDLGESFGAYTIGLDSQVIPYVSSANVACGYICDLFGHNSRAIYRAYEVLQFGELYVNGFSTGPMLPHTGMRESGVGCDASQWGLKEYFSLKRLTVKP